MDDAAYAVRIAGFENMRELGDITTIVCHAFLLRWWRREVEADDVLAAIG